MAELAFPDITTTTKLPSGTTYSYVHVPAKDSKPYILFLHGFPSSAYDWRHQIGHFSERGYGLLVPDLLGYGATDKPQEKEAYRLKKMSKEVVEILDICGVEMVIGVGHDWGSFFLSRLANYYPARFSKYAFLDIAYAPPNADGFDFEAINEETTKLIGYPVFGYWDFFKDEDSGPLMTEKIDLTASVCYTAFNHILRDKLCPLGAAREYWTSGTPSPIASWVTPDEIALHKKIFAKDQGGYGPPLNWYKCQVANLNTPDEAQVPKDNWYLKSPTLFVKCKNDPVGVPAVQAEGMKPWIKDELLEVVEIDSGHWCLLEKPRETNEALERFIVGGE